MPGHWAGSTRAARLPTDWDQRKRQVWARDGTRCWLCGADGADTIDHKVPGDNHDLDNLGPVHDRTWPHCHRYKSSAEGNAARSRPTNRRPPEPHPGIRPAPDEPPPF